MKIKPSIAISENGFLFDPNSGESFTTNTMGREIVTMLKQHIPEEEIKATLLERYDVDEITLEKNMIDFIAMLHHFNLCDETPR